MSCKTNFILSFSTKTIKLYGKGRFGVPLSLSATLVQKSSNQYLDPLSLLFRFECDYEIISAILFILLNSPGQTGLADGCC